MMPLAKRPAIAEPGRVCAVGFLLGVERYRYPKNLPKVAATGGPQCTGLPKLAVRDAYRRSWSPTTAPTRRSTETRASC